MESHLRAGVAIFNEGRYHAAHDAWEDHWLGLESGSQDELLLHGLIQYTAAVHHAENENWAGVEGLAESAGQYLAGLPEDYRGIELGPVRDVLARAAEEPTSVVPEDAPKLTHQGEMLGYADLDFEATAVAADVLVEEEGYDESTMDRALAYATEEVGESGGGTFTGLVFSFVRGPDQRGLVFDRLSRHVERERSKDEDVDGLFD